MSKRPRFSSFILALGLCSLRVKKINISSFLWAESLTQKMQIPSVFYLPLHTFLDVWRDQHGGCSSRSQQSLTHNPKLIYLAGQIKPVASDACSANTDLTQITAQPCSSSQFRWPLGMESSPWSLLTAQILYLAIPLPSLQLPYSAVDLTMVFLPGGGAIYCFLS